MLFLCDLKFEKGDKKVSQKTEKFAKRQIRTQVDRVQKEYDKHSTIYATGADDHTVLCNVDDPNHTLVGGVSIKRHSQHVIWHFFFDDEPARPLDGRPFWTSPEPPDGLSAPVGHTDSLDWIRLFNAR